MFRQKDPNPWSPGAVILIKSRHAESNVGTTRCAQTRARRIFGFSKSLAHAAGDGKKIAGINIFTVKTDRMEMSKRRTDVPFLIVGIIFIIAGVYAFVVDELIFYSRYVGASKGHRVAGYTQLVIDFSLFLGGSFMIWTKGKW